MKLAALMGIPTSAIMFFYAHEIMQHWLSAKFDAKSSSVLMILAAANLLYAFTTVPAVTLDATGRIKVATACGKRAVASSVSAMRLPQISRDNTSRPRLSVPRGKIGSPPVAHAGGSRIDKRFCSEGSCGAIEEANAAQNPRQRINPSATSTLAERSERDIVPDISAPAISD